MPQPLTLQSHSARSKIAERFLSHAELWRHMASQCWDKEIAEKLEQLAQECERAARSAGGGGPSH